MIRTRRTWPMSRRSTGNIKSSSTAATLASSLSTRKPSIMPFTSTWVGDRGYVQLCAHSLMAMKKRKLADVHFSARRRYMYFRVSSPSYYIRKRPIGCFSSFSQSPKHHRSIHLCQSARFVSTALSIDIWLDRDRKIGKVGGLTLHKQYSALFYLLANP